MIRSGLAAIVLGYLPGALLFRIPVLNRRARAVLSAEERLFWGVLLSVVWSILVVLALAAVGQYRFERLLAVNAIVGALILIGWRMRLRYENGAPRPSWPALIPIAIVALAIWQYFPPSEYVMGGKDPGTYLNEGVQIAQRGGLVVSDPMVKSVPVWARDLFLPSYHVAEYDGLRFMGFFIQDPDSGTVVGQFPHAFPASIAIGYGLNGLSGARQAVGVWAILGLLAVYFAGARAFGRTAAAVATLLLSINVVEVWFARYPNSELATQALLFAAILAFSRAVDDSGSRLPESTPGVFFGSVAGALLGVTFLLRFEAVLAIAAFGAAVTLLPAVRQRIGAAFVIVLAIFGGAGLLYLLGPMRAYAKYPFDFLYYNHGWWLIGGGLVLAFIARRVLRIEAVAAIVRRTVPIALAVSMVGLAIYAYFFRQQSGATAIHDAMAFRTFGWYVTPWLLGVAVIGAAALCLARFWREPALFLTFAAYTIFYFYKTKIVPEHFWASRRFLVMALPGALLFAVALFTEVNRLAASRSPARPAARGDAPRRRVNWRTVAVVFAAALIFAELGNSFWRAADPVRHHVEYAGLIPKLEQLAAKVGDRDLLVVESRDASDLHVLALPLVYIYARNVLVLSSRVPDKRTWEHFVSWAGTQYARVLFLGGGGTDLLTEQVSATPIGSDRFQIPEYDSPENAYPSGVRHKEFDYSLYRVESVTSATRGPIDLTIGTRDDLNVVRFLAKELRPDTGPFRWTRDTSYVLLLDIAPDAKQVTIWMSNGGRPVSAPPATVEVSLGETVLGTATPEDAVRPYAFALPADVVRWASTQPDPVRLRLRVPTWNPETLLHVSDSRDLGVMVTRVTVR